MCHDRACENEKACLRERIAALEAELARFQKPPRDSNNSSLPPSQDPFTRRYPKRPKSQRPSGGQEGHAGHHHPFSEPDDVRPLYPDTCEYCGSSELIPLEGDKQRCQEVNLPDLKPVITEYRQYEALCRHCAKRSRGRFPSHLKAPVQMGASLSGWIGYLKQIQHMSHQRIVHFFRDLFGLSLSEGFVNNRLEKLTQQHQDTYDAIGQALPHQALIGSDETRHRIHGKNNYQWIFQNESLSYFVGNVSRKFDVIRDLFGESFSGTWVSDRYGAQLKMKASHQVCLAHLIRDLQYVRDAHADEPWATTLQALLREAIHFRKEQGAAFDPIHNRDVFGQCQQFRERLAELFQKPPPEPEAKRLFTSLLGRQEQLFHFLSDPKVPYDNNASERALRQPVVHRNVLGGFRADTGSKTQDVLLSVIQTAQKQGLSVFDVLCNKQPLLLPS